MRRTHLLSIIFLLSFSMGLYSETSSIDEEISALSEKLASAYKQKKEINFKKRIAIAEFENQSEAAKKNSIGEAVAELLATEFSRSTIFILVERKNLDKVLKEQELQLTGATESDSVVKAGKIMNADAILYGSITELGNSFNVTAKLVDVETGAMVSETISIDKDQMLDTREKLLDMAFVQKMGVGISINLVAQTTLGNNCYIWRDIGAEVKYRFTKNIMISVGVEMVGADIYKNADMGWQMPKTTPWTQGRGPFIITADGIGFPINLYLVLNLSRHLNLFVSGGAEKIIAKAHGWFDANGDPAKGAGAGFGENEYGPTVDVLPWIGMARIGLEYFITPRMALSFRTGYDFGTADLDLSSMWHLRPDLPKTMNASLNGLFLGPSFSFYF